MYQRLDHVFYFQLPIVKEEVVDTEHRSHPRCPTSEHNYFAVLAPTPTPENVKTEIIVPVETPEDEQGYNSDVIFEEFVYERTSRDIKQPIIEVVADNYENFLENVEDGSKVEVDTIHLYESKPAVEVIVEDTPETEEVASKDSRRKDENRSYEFCEKDLMLRDGEDCNVDMELIEATIMKKTNPDMRFKCPKCPKSFKFFKGLRRHGSVHEISNGVYTCDFCLGTPNSTYKFANLKTLQSHIFTKHLKDATYWCKLCSIQFRTQLEQKMHMKQAHPHAYKCKVCARSFTFK